MKDGAPSFVDRFGGRARPVTTLGLSLLFALGAAPPQEQDAEVPEFPSRVELVTVGVVVTDSEGRPVGGLTRDDFALEEDGASQTLSTFEAIEIPERPTATPTRRVVVSTNVPAQAAARTGRWFGVVVDDIHLQLREALHAKAAATALLETAAEGDQVTLATTSGEVWWSARMSAGRSELLALLERVGARAVPDQGPDWMSPNEAQRIWVHGDRAVADYVERRFSSNGIRRSDLIVSARAPEVYSEALAKCRQTLEVMERMLRPLETTERPGALILLSGGFIHDSTLPGLGRVLDASQRSNVPVYFVDSRALVGMPAHFGADRGVSSVPGLPVMQGLDRPGAEIAPPGEYSGFDADRDERFFGASGPESLALDSGGLVVRNTNDPSPGLKRIADESRVYYLLGYHPTNAAHDGTFRKIEVEVSGKGLDVRARKGYRAPLEGDTPSREGSGSEDPWYQPALDSPVGLAAVPLRVASYAFHGAEFGRARVVLATEVDIRDLEFRDEGGRSVDALDVLLLVGQPGSGELTREDVTAGLKLRPATRKEMEASWFPVSRELELGPGAYQARVVVRARNSGRVGSVVHRFEVPEPSGLHASSVVLTDRLDSKPDWTMSELEPRIVAHRAFPAGTTLFVHYEVYGAAGDPGTGRPRVRSGLEIRRRDGTVLGRGEPVALKPEDLRALKAWIDLNCPLWPDYRHRKKRPL